MTNESWTFDESGYGTLITALRQRPLALVGAGSSESVDYPGWADLIARLTEEAAVLRPDEPAQIARARAMPDLAVRATMLRRLIGQEAYHAFLRRTFGPEETDVGPLPLAIVRLPFRHVLTTNYDAVLESAHAHSCGSRPPRILYSNRTEMGEFLARMNRDDYSPRYVFLHGRYDEPSSIVLTEDDYREHYHHTSRARQDLHVLLTAQTIVSIGFSLSDADVMAGYRYIDGAYRAAPRHVAIVPQPEHMALDDARLFLKEKYGVQAVFYPVDGKDHSRLLDLLALAARENTATALAAPCAAEALTSRVEQEVAAAFKAFQQEEFTTAGALFESLLPEVERLLSETPGDVALQRLVSRARLGRASIYFTNGDTDSAAALVARVDPKVLDRRDDRLRLIRHHIRIGALELAEGLIAQEENDQDLIAARQYIQIKRGGVAADLARVDWLLIEAGAFHLGEGRLADAIACATDALMVTQRHLVKAAAFQILVASLLASATNEERVAPLSVAQRISAVQRAEELSAKLEEFPLPSRTLADVRAALLRFYIAAFNRDGVARVTRVLRETGEDLQLADLGFRDAVEIAATGRVTDAMARLAVDAPEWWQRLQAIQLYKAAGELTNAAEETLKLVSDWPGLSVVEYEAAHVHLAAGDYTRALFHARRAYESLPGMGQRLALAQCHIAAGAHRDAHALLQSLEHVRTPEVLRARALALDVVDIASAAPCWQEYLAFEKADSRARVHLAALLLHLGRDTEAAAEAWTAATSAGAERLSAQALYECALFQAAAPLAPALMAERLRGIAERLRSRRNADPEAETVFLALYFQLDSPQDLPPPDLERLESLGIVRAASAADVAKHFGALQERHTAIWRAYSAGTLTFSYLCKLSRVPAAVVVTSAALSRTPLSAPAWPSASRPVSLVGLEILVGQLELLVLHHLSLLEAFEEACRQGARLLIFEDVQRRILEEAVEVPARFHASALERYTRLWDFLSSAPSVSLEKRAPTSDDFVWANDKGIRVVTRSSSPNTITPSAVAAWLGQSGIVPLAVVDRYRSRFGDGDDPVDPGPAFSMDFGSVIEFDEAGLLQGLVASAGITVHLGPQATAGIRGRLDDLKAQKDAAERARSVHGFVGRGLSAGWLSVIPRPSVSLPPLRSPEAPGPFRDGIAEALTWRTALLGHRRRRLLSCDFLVTSLFTATTPVPLLSALSWTPPTYRRAAARARSVEKRCLALPEVLAGLGLDAAALPAFRRKLAELGFSSALQWQDILALAQEHPGLAKGVPQQVLDGFERVARDRNHPAARMAMLEVARRYANSIWAVFREDWPTEDRSSFVSAILGRLKALESAGVGRPVETALRFFGALVFSEPRHAFVPSDDGRARLSDESPTGKAWTYFVAWAGRERGTAAALSRGVQDALLLLDGATAPEGPSEAQCAATVLALTHLAGEDRPFSLARPRLASVGILSSRWRNRPLAGYTFSVRASSGTVTTLVPEDVLASAANLVGERFEELKRDGDSWTFAFPLTDGSTMDVALPPEAVLLRASGDGVRDAALALAAEQGPHDGAAHALLSQLAQDPTSARLRDLVARRGASSPWRAIREDPTSLLLWGIAETAPLGVQAASGLLELLSEPCHIRSHSIEDELLQRTSTGGAWEHRQDADFLLSECLLSAWPLSIYECGRRLAHRDPNQLAEDCLERLNGIHGFPVTHVAVDLISAMLAVPRVSSEPLREGLRSRVAECIERILVETARVAPEGSFAYVETRINRECADAVSRVCGPTIGTRDQLWLSRRLFQWFFRQLQLAAPEAADLTLATFARTRSLDPGGASSLDVLDPRNDSPELLNARLVTILYALNVGLHPEVYLAQDSGLSADASGRLSEVALSTLGELASRPFTDFERAIRGVKSPTQLVRWAGPCTVPDLAIAALIRVDVTPLRRLSPDARHRWLSELAPPSITQASGMPTIVALGLMLAVARGFDDLSDEEVSIVRARCVADLEWPPDWEPMRLLLLASLYDRGHADVASRILHLLGATLGQPTTRQLLPALFEVAAKRSPEFLTDVVALVLSGIPDNTDRLASLAGLEKLLDTPGNDNVVAAARTAILRNAKLMDLGEPRVARLVQLARS